MPRVTKTFRVPRIVSVHVSRSFMILTLSHRKASRIAAISGSVMAEKKTARGRKPPDGEEKQFLTSMNPDVIRRIKAAAALRDKTASVLLEEAAKDWLERHPDGKK